MRIYLDNNPYDHLLGAGISSEQLSIRLQAHGHELIISGDNFQEWASCWKSGLAEKEEVGRTLLRYAFGIRPRILIAGPDDLIRREMAALLGQHQPGPFLPEADVVNAENLFQRFIDGAATEDDRSALLSRWAQKEESVRHATELSAAGTTTDTSLSLEAFINANPEGYKRTVRTYIEKWFTPASATQIKFFANRLHKCPALSAAIRADLYVNWRLATGKKMQHDRWDDLRHCIVSSYAHLFVTNDEQLRQAFAQIEPGPRVIMVRKLAELLGLSYAGP
jgi:hypothetical protein